MADIQDKLLTDRNDVPIPQHVKDGESKFEKTKGSNGAQHVKIVDSSGNPLSKIEMKNNTMEARLSSIEEKLDSVIEDNAINTQVTGSITENKIVDDEELESDSRIEGSFTVDNPFRIIFEDSEEVDDFYIVVKGSHLATGAYPYLFYREEGENKLGFSKGKSGFSKIYTPVQKNNNYRIVNDSESDTKVTIWVVEYKNAVSNEFTKSLYGGEMKDGDDL